MNHQTIVAALLLGTALSACAKGSSRPSAEDKEIIEKTVQLSRYDKIEAATGIKVAFSQGALTPAQIKAPRYVLEYLRVKVDEGTLELNLDKRFFEKYNRFNGEVTVSVTAPAVNSFEASSGASITVISPLKVSGNADFEASSGGNINIAGSLDATGKIEIEASSGASVKASGTKGTACDIDAASGADVTIAALDARDLSVDASSAGSIEITKAMTVSAVADLSSGADSKIAGTTRRLSVDASSGSTFNGKDFKAGSAIIDSESGATVHFNSSNPSVDADSTGSAHNHH